MNLQGTQSFTKFCPACKLGNDANALTCRHCGSALDLVVRGQPLEKESSVPAAYTSPAIGLALYLSGSTTPIAVTNDREFILGRKADEEVSALVDLSEPDGFAMGVSRRHAMVRSSEHGYVIIDLNSSNGTWLNGKILIPTQQYDLPNGGLIQLGRLKLVAMYKSAAN